jgi:sugar phosphate isomerase/epimerase
MKRWPLVAMENTLFSDVTLDWDRRCAVIAAAGFDGVYAVPYPLQEADFSRLRHLSDTPSRHGLLISAVYANLDLGLPPEHPASQRLERLFASMDGIARVELSCKCSDASGCPAKSDDALLRRLEGLMAIANRRGFAVALYPHSFYPLETIADARRIIRRFGHPRLRFVFATSHVYAISSADGVLNSLRDCASEIASFNVCGCRRLAANPPARCSHHPLDESDLELSPLFATLAGSRYAGEIVVQGQGWRGDLPAMLARCVTFMRAGGPGPAESK